MKKKVRLGYDYDMTDYDCDALCLALIDHILVSGTVDGQKWLREDKYEINHICKLHCKRHETTWSNE